MKRKNVRNNSLLAIVIAIAVFFIISAILPNQPAADVDTQQGQTGDLIEIGGASSEVGSEIESADPGTDSTGDLDSEVSNEPVDSIEETVEYFFRNQKLLDQHYDKHGKEMGFASAKEYEKAASNVVNNPNALHKIESEDGDDVYFVEDTGEFVVVSTDGYIRTYFIPNSGKKYFDRQ